MKIPLNGDQFDACLESGKYAGEVEEEIAEGTAAGVNGTPAFFIGPSGSGEKITGTIVSGAQPLTRFKQVIEEVLITSGQDGKFKPKKKGRKKNLHHRDPLSSRLILRDIKTQVGALLHDNT